MEVSSLYYDMAKRKKKFKMSNSWKIAFLVALSGSIVLILLLLDRSQSISIWEQEFINQMDKNGDGNSDEWLITGFTLKKKEFKKDKNYDGRIDYREIYKDDRLKMVEVDFDYNGTFETVAQYDTETGFQILLEKDTNNDGKFDVRATYDDKGRPLSKEIDKDFDGSFDIIVNNKVEGGK